MAGETLQSGAGVSRRWWLVATLAGLASMAFVWLVWSHPTSRITWLLAGGLLVFVVVLWRNPRFWYRRMAAGLLAVAAGSGAIPSIAASLDVGHGQAFLLVEQGTPYFAAICVVMAGFFGLLDYWSHFPRATRSCAGSIITGAAGSQSIVQVNPNIDRSPGAKVEVTVRNEGGVESEACRKIINRFESSVADQKAHLEAAIQDLKAQLRAALARVAGRADQGDPAAQAALDEARQSGDAEQLQSVLMEAAAQAEKALDRHRDLYVGLCREIAAVAYLRGDIGEAQGRLEAILQLRPGDADATNSLGHVAFLRGELDRAEQLYRQVLTLAGHHPVGRAVAYGNLGVIYQTRGDLEQAERMFRKALDTNQKLDRLEGMAAAYGNLGLIYQTRGDLEHADQMLRKALEIHRKLGRPDGMAAAYANLGLIYRGRGDLEQAEQMLRKALEIEQKLGRQDGMAKVYGSLGLVYLTRGDLQQAEQMHRKALEINQKLGRIEGMATAYGNLGLIYLTRGDLERAEEMLRKALQTNEKLGRLEGMAIQYANLGSIQKKRGDTDRAREYWNKALELYRKIGMSHMVQRVQGWLDALPPE